MHNNHEKLRLNNKGNNEFDSFVQLKIELESLSKDYNRYLSNVSQLSNWKEILAQYKKNNELFLGKAKELDPIFEQMTLRVLGHQYSLSFPEDLDSFPIICSEGNKSSGEKKAVAACFVFSLLTLYEKEGRDMPMFLVQDQMEGVTASILAKLENEALACHCQYIIPILSDRAEQITDIDEKAILTLSKNDKLFGI